VVPSVEITLTVFFNSSAQHAVAALALVVRRGLVLVVVHRGLL
jgi:hypothetical protein